MRIAYTAGDYKNTASKSREKIQETSYLVGTLELNDGSLADPQVIGFVVSHSRGYEDYLKVKKHPSNARFGRYCNSLLDSMFKRW